MMKMAVKRAALAGFCLVFTACSNSVPESFSENGKTAPIYPDYTNCMLPVNLGPMNFAMTDSADAYVVSVSPANGDKIVVGSDSKKSFSFPADKWKKMLEANANNDITFDVYAKNDGKWSHYKSFVNHVSPDSIDRYLTYRLIEPSYMGSGEMGVYQYDIENNVESAIFTNHFAHKDPNVRGQKCVNCHTSQRNHPENKMFYYRGANGGLFLTYNGQLKKINTRTGDMFAGTVYPAWHPTLPLIAFSSNVIKQVFKTFDSNKIEPFDMYSDLVLYNIEKNEITSVLKTRNSHETNPNWSPDGKYLYYNSSDSTFEKIGDVKRLRYNLFRISFNADSLKWGSPELVYDAASSQHSATYPRVSPDGQNLLFTLAAYGTSTQTNKTADLCMIDLKSMKSIALDSVNSPTESDSYHDWASNSRWFVYSSRRYDGNYSRPYFVHVSADGKVSKPVQMPHSNARHDLDLLKCYNVPEFSKKPVVFSESDFQNLVNSEEVKATYGSPIDKNADAVTGASKVK